jgi:hypothetical protein
VSQADVVKFRAVRVNSADAAVSAGPTDGAGVTAPHFQMSPVAPSGMPTMGFIFMLKSPSASPATAGAGGFTVVIWFRDPNSQRWGSSVSVSVAYGQTWICNDVDAMDGLVFQITNIGVAGDIDIHFAEQ